MTNYEGCDYLAQKGPIQSQSVTVNVSDEGIKMDLLMPFIEELAGIPADLEWRVRGVSGHEEADREAEEELAKRRAEIPAFLQSEQGKKKIESFAQEVIQVYKLMQYGKIRELRNYVNRRLLFVVGIWRSGGTYMTQQLHSIFGMDITNYKSSIMHDAIPRGQVLENLFVPSYWEKMYLDLAQTLVWLKRSYQNEPVFIQKRGSYAYVLNVIEYLFGDLAHVICTVRHPAACAFSFGGFYKQGFSVEELFESLDFGNSVYVWKTGISNERWKKTSYLRKFLQHWLMCYESIAFSKNDGLRFDVIPFGEQYNTYLQQIAEEYGGTADFDRLHIKPDFYKPIVEKAEEEYGISKEVETVRRLWEQHGKEFPELNPY